MTAVGDVSGVVWEGDGKLLLDGARRVGQPDNQLG